MLTQPGVEKERNYDAVPTQPTARATATANDGRRANAPRNKKTYHSIMFSLTAAGPCATRVSTSLRVKNQHPRRRATTIVASTNWSLDYEGCAGKRNDDDGKVLKGGKSVTCLTVPIDVSALMTTREGDLEFEGEKLRFEQSGRGDALVVQSLQGRAVIDGQKIGKGKKIKVKPGSKITVDKEAFTVYRNAHAHA